MNNFRFLNLDIPLFKEGITFRDVPKAPIAILDKEKYLNEKMFKFFDSLDLEISFVETFFKRAYNKNKIHIDGTGNDYTKLNWVFGGGQSKMNWYAPLDNTLRPLFKNAIDTSYVAYTPEQVTEIESSIIQNPTLVQVGVPHNVVNITEDRLCISILYRNKINKNRISMSESVQTFKKYII
jgi:hypothetical protein